jgi:hypothetical protein
MTALATRKQVGLESKLAALTAEFDLWLRLTSKGGELEKHHTQMRAITGHLGGLRDVTERMLNEAKQSGDILTQARNLESLVLGIRRIWEFFRSKLVQRREAEMHRFLQMADELAWSCYKPVIDVAISAVRREPPLVFLNGGLSPYAQSRDQAFLAEEVPGEALSGKTYDPILKRLPIPVIGVPWYQAAHIPDLSVVAHETGHTVEQDFALHERTLKNIGQVLQGTAGAARLGCWEAWSTEVFADLWGCLSLGPAFVSSLTDFLASDRDHLKNEVATASDKYPTAHIRILLCLNALQEMGFVGETEALREAWVVSSSDTAMRAFEDDVPLVVKAVLSSNYPHMSPERPLLETPELRFTQQDWCLAKKGVAELRQGKIPESANTARRLVAAARFLFDQDPQGYARDALDKALQEHMKSIIRPGTRSGEKILDQIQQDQLSAHSRALGTDWFDQFASWCAARTDVLRASP